MFNEHSLVVNHAVAFVRCFHSKYSLIINKAELSYDTNVELVIKKIGNKTDG